MKTTKVFIPGLGERKKDYTIDWCYDIDWNNPKLTFKEVDTLVAFSLGCILAINHAAKYRVENLILFDAPIKVAKSRLKVGKLKYITLPKHRMTNKLLNKL